ncbi:hypothetical protein ACFO8O_13035 [Hephaestia sp. GCM10023244]|uniref:hypothetical protein n=1 Tax=unclassified Hephaestia TaxID=2631281 RepID=UPI002077437C|nr:hypothetical protein [Hephaestia sp. MAHUQ-44]MCM8731885.1 hypothetical protein [Hephaestia sp. MAHUQ-44]
MQAFRPVTAFQRHLMIVLFACAVLVRMGVPEGWMPITDTAGTVRLTLCSGTGPLDPVAAPAGHDHDGAHHATGHGDHATAHTEPAVTHGDHAGAATVDASHDHASLYDHGSHPCTFAGLGLAASLPDLVLAPAVVPAMVQPRAPVRAVTTVGHGLAAPPPPPTGPPLLA